VIRLAVRCRTELADRVLAELLEIVPGGVEEERWTDPAAPGRGAEEAAGIVEFAIYGAPGELPAIPDLEAVAGDGLVEISSTEIPDDWADAWRDFHEPVWVEDRLLVRPSWETEVAGQPDVEVVVDPGQAFGTGAHATTRMCLELLLELADAGRADGPLADLGTGSGVLAIAAAKLGWAPVIACDSEPAALEAAAENARANSVELALSRVNLREQAPPAADTLVANITAPLLSEVAARLGSAPSALVCSGLLGAERDRVSKAFANRGLEVASERTQGGWAALALRPVRHRQP
jgi:ribosomal protein L11 methyltransferase